MTAAAFAGVLLLGGAACSDENGDGAEVDEEVGEIEEGAEDLGNEIEEGAEDVTSEGEDVTNEMEEEAG